MTVDSPGSYTPRRLTFRDKSKQKSNIFKHLGLWPRWIRLQKKLKVETLVGLFCLLYFHFLQIIYIYIFKNASLQPCLQCANPTISFRFSRIRGPRICSSPVVMITRHGIKDQKGKQSSSLLFGGRNFLATLDIFHQDYFEEKYE